MKKQLLTIIVLAFMGWSNMANAQAPNWAWAKSAGGNLYEQGHSVTTDAGGNVYVTGYFNTNTITFGTIVLSNSISGQDDMFIVKYDATGQVVWAKCAGGTALNQGLSVAVDAGGNVYVTGEFYTPSIIFGTDTLNCTGIIDMFVVKYNSAGQVLWAKSAIGSAGDMGYSVCPDALGNVFVAGYFESPTIFFGNTTLTNSGVGYGDMFLVKYNSAGTVLWAKRAGGSAGADMGVSVITDASGNVYVTGLSEGPSIVFGSTTLYNAGGADMFIVKYDTNGNVIWAKSEGGSGYDSGTSVRVDAAGNVYESGYFDSPTLVIGTTTLTNAGTYDSYLTKYDASGQVLWAKSAGGSGWDVALSMDANANGDLFISGYFDSPSLVFGNTTLNNTGGSKDIYVAKYDATGQVMWAKSAGGNTDDWCFSVAADIGGYAYLTGYFNSPSITFGGTTLINADNSGISNDIFLAKLDVVTGIDENTLNNSITIAPNPFTSQTTITFSEEQKNTTIKIMNVLGECIQQLTTNNQQLTLDMSGLAKGVYFLSVNSQQGVVNRKIVKE